MNDSQFKSGVCGIEPPAFAGKRCRTPALATDRALVTLDSIGEAVISVDVAGIVTYLNPAAERMIGWRQHEALRRPLSEVFRIIDPESRLPAPNSLAMAILHDRSIALSEHRILVRRDASETDIEGTAAPIHDSDGRVSGAVIVFRDVGATRALALRMSHLAQHDFLTQLPNRMLLGDRLTTAIATAHRHQMPLAVLYVDVDHFKRINDSCGHAIGDQVLRSIARRLLACVRGSDTVSRQGGDEFVVLLAELTRGKDAAMVAQEMLKSVAAPHRIGDLKLHATVSIGIGLYPDHATDAETLIHRADSALLCAKCGGRNGYRYFRSALEGRTRGGVDTEKHVQSCRVGPASADAVDTADDRNVA